jgi:hypothetical protein
VIPQDFKIFSIVSPTPPAPKIKMESLIETFASFFRTPKAVVNAHPSKGSVELDNEVCFMVVTLFSETTANLLNVVTHPALSVLPLQLYTGGAD